MQSTHLRRHSEANDMPMTVEDTVATGMTAEGSEADVLMVQEVLHRIASDLALVTDREVRIEEGSVYWAEMRPVGRDRIHISFRFTIAKGGDEHQACVLLPLPEAITLASYLMMVPDEDIPGDREKDTLDGTMKNAIMEVGRFMGEGIDAAMRESTNLSAEVRFAGCQGVRANVRPALDYQDGDRLLTGSTRANIEQFSEFDLWVAFPALVSSS